MATFYTWQSLILWHISVCFSLRVMSACGNKEQTWHLICVKLLTALLNDFVNSSCYGNVFLIGCLNSTMPASAHTPHLVFFTINSFREDTLRYVSIPNEITLFIFEQNSSDNTEDCLFWTCFTCFRMIIILSLTCCWTVSAVCVLECI